ncbi:MAG: sensor histidine kinase [Promethearchaeota archaeon]
MDITQRKQAEEKLSQLISTVSHELRTPITVLMMSIDYLTKNKDLLNDELEGKLMDGISRNIQLLNQLAEDILLISRIDEKGLTLDLIEYNPLEIINEILYLMEPIGKEKNVSFEINIDNAIRLKGDPKRIDQIFRVILDNAIKYSKENSKVEISALKNYQGKYNLDGYPGVLFQFKDYGHGIPKEDIPRIFERFFRSSNVNEIAGTGLGLSIAKDLIEAHKGNISVESELEKGTTIYVFLPQIE